MPSYSTGSASRTGEFQRIGREIQKRDPWKQASPAMEPVELQYEATKIGVGGQPSEGYAQRLVSIFRPRRLVMS
jgi:hypothetical protein